MNDVKGFEDYKAEKEPGSVFPNQKNMRRYVKSLKDIVDFYNPQSGNVTRKKGEGLKILTNQQVSKKYGNKLLDNSLNAGKDFAKIAGKKAT